MAPFDGMLTQPVVEFAKALDVRLNTWLRHPPIQNQSRRSRAMNVRISTVVSAPAHVEYMDVNASAIDSA